MLFTSYLGLVPGFSFFAAAGCDVLVLSLNISHDLIHVQGTGVVHLDHYRGPLQALLQLTQLLFCLLKQHIQQQ